MATKQRNTEIYSLVRAVNQYTHPHDHSTLFGYCRYNIPYRAALGHDIVNDENSLSGLNSGTPPESPPPVSSLLGVGGSQSQLLGYLKG